MKKVLAWAVVLALVLSSFTMAFAGQTKTSKDFKDASQIHYTEAVDVMVATGVINGYPDGTFGPAKTVKRSEMAKMIAVMMNGGEDVGDQYKSACPFKDSKNHWAAGYIAYCATEHIIDGRSADVFDPEAEVTGTEVAKMALTSLGYDSKVQGYTGETWAAAVLKDAKKVGLFEGLDKSFVPGNPCDRESAAEILFNALQANEVEYPTSITVNTGDTEVDISGGIREKGPLYKDVFDKNSDATLEKKTGEAAQDDFGRPGHAWKCEGDDVGTYSDPVDYEFTAEKTTVPEAIEAYDKELAKTLTADKYNFTTKINGQANSQATLALGDKVELYVTEAEEGAPAGTKGSVEVIVIKYVPAQITKVDTKKISKEEAEKGITAKLTLDTDAAVKSADNTMAGYDESAYVEGAVIAVAVGQKDGKAAILDSYVPEELVAGTVTKIKNTTYTIDGKDYDPTGAFKPFGGNLEVKGDYTVYDYSGYMFASVKGKAAAAEKFYGVITDKKTDTNSTGWTTDVPETKQLVRIFTAEGQMEEFTLAEKETIPEGIVVEAEGKTTVTPTLISYEKNENGEVKAIAKATAPNPEGSMSGKAMANNGILYGREVSDGVVAFANIGKDKPEWKAYKFEDLEAAKKVDISAYIDENGAALLALMVGSLEETVSDEMMAIVTSVDPITNEDGAAYEIKAFVNGEAKTFTTRKIEGETDQLGVLAKQFAKPAELVMLTMKDGKVDSARVAKCQGVPKASEEFATGIDAVFYGTGAYAIESMKPVIGKDGSSLNVGTDPKTDNDFQACTGAKVYFVNDKNEVSVSDLDSIEEGNVVVLMKLSKDSSTWDTVFFKEVPASAPEGPFTVTWNISNDAPEGFQTSEYFSVIYGSAITNGFSTTVTANEITFSVYDRTSTEIVVKANGNTIQGTPAQTESGGTDPNTVNYTVPISGNTTIEVIGTWPTNEP